MAPWPPQKKKVQLQTAKNNNNKKKKHYKESHFVFYREVVRSHIVPLHIPLAGFTGLCVSQDYVFCLQLSRHKSTDQELLFGFCLRRAHETDFFIRKAIGWALREYTKTNKTAVKKFVAKNKSNLSALSTKEALKHC